MLTHIGKRADFPAARRKDWYRAKEELRKGSEYAAFSFESKPGSNAANTEEAILVQIVPRAQMSPVAGTSRRRCAQMQLSRRVGQGPFQSHGVPRREPRLGSSDRLRSSGSDYFIPILGSDRHPSGGGPSRSLDLRHCIRILPSPYHPSASLPSMASRTRGSRVEGSTSARLSP